MSSRLGLWGDRTSQESRIRFNLRNPQIAAIRLDKVPFEWLIVLVKFADLRRSILNVLNLWVVLVLLLVWLVAQDSSCIQLKLGYFLDSQLVTSCLKELLRLRWQRCIVLRLCFLFCNKEWIYSLKIGLLSCLICWVWFRFLRFLFSDYHVAWASRYISLTTPWLVKGIFHFNKGLALAIVDHILEQDRLITNGLSLHVKWNFNVLIYDLPTSSPAFRHQFFERRITHLNLICERVSCYDYSAQ